MKKRVFGYYSFLIISVCIGVYFYTVEKVDSVKKVEKATSPVVMATMDQIPYGFTSLDGKKSGVLYDILNEIIRVSGVGQINKIVPPKRIVSQMTSNKKMCMLAVGSPSVESTFDLIEPIGYELVSGILPKAGIKLNEYSDIKDLTIAVPLGIDINDNIDTDLNINFSLVSSSRYINAIRMVHHGRVDAVLGGLSPLLYIARTEGLTADYFGKALVLNRYDVQLVCTYSISKKSRQQLKNAVIKLKENGAINAILKNYFVESDFEA